jgi:hypothetical protein
LVAASTRRCVGAVCAQGRPHALASPCGAACLHPRLHGPGACAREGCPACVVLICESEIFCLRTVIALLCAAASGTVAHVAAHIGLEPPLRERRGRRGVFLLHARRAATRLARCLIACVSLVSAADTLAAVKRPPPCYACCTVDGPAAPHLPARALLSKHTRGVATGSGRPPHTHSVTAPRL